jgi:hypothetical protein
MARRSVWLVRVPNRDAFVKDDGSVIPQSDVVTVHETLESAQQEAEKVFQSHTRMISGRGPPVISRQDSVRQVWTERLPCEYVLVIERMLTAEEYEEEEDDE